MRSVAARLTQLTAALAALRVAEARSRNRLAGLELLLAQTRRELA